MNDEYYAIIPGSKTDDGKTLYFWTGRSARRGIPSSYGWSDRPEDKCLMDQSTLLEFLYHTLILDIDQGEAEMDEVDIIEIYRVVNKTEVISEDVTNENGKKTTIKKTLETVTDELTDIKLSKGRLEDIGEEEFGWNGAEEYHICPSCGEDGWTGDHCPNCGYDYH